MQCHKRSLKLNEDHVKRIRAYRDEFWNESIVVFKNPQFDFTAAPRIVFAGEAGVDAGGLGREYGLPVVQQNKWKLYFTNELQKTLDRR